MLRLCYLGTQAQGTHTHSQRVVFPVWCQHQDIFVSCRKLGRDDIGPALHCPGDHRAQFYSRICAALLPIVTPSPPFHSNLSVTRNLTLASRFCKYSNSCSCSRRESVIKYRTYEKHEATAADAGRLSFRYIRMRI